MHLLWLYQVDRLAGFSWGHKGICIQIADDSPISASTTPSAHEAATAGTGIVDSSKVEPLAPEKGTYA